MKIVVVGAGAMGSLFAGYLGGRENEVWAYDIWGEHTESIRRHGLRMVRGGAERRVRLHATTDPAEPGPADLVLLFVKYGDTRRAVRDSLSMIAGHTSVLTLQNGIGNVEIIREFVPEDRVLFGLTTLTSELLGPGLIEESFHGRGETYLWPLNGRVDDRAEGICAELNRCGIHSVLAPDVELRIWKKLIVNACYNTLSAIVGLKVGDLIDEPDIWPALEGTVSEIVQIAQRRGIPLEEGEAQAFLKQVGEEARNHYPSMLIDVQRQRRTEIECLNGTIVRDGERFGVPTPFNRVLYGIIRVLENTYPKRVREQGRAGA